MAPPPPRVLPRPRSHREHAVRRRPQAPGWVPRSGPGPSRARARAQVGRRGALRGMTDSSGPPNAISQEQVRAVEQDLTVSIKGEVRVDNGARAIYSTDASNYRHLPFGVVIPKSTDDVVAAVEACRRHGVPITSRRGGTGLAGQSCNTAVV